MGLPQNKFNSEHFKFSRGKSTRKHAKIKSKAELCTVNLNFSCPIGKYLIHVFFFFFFFSQNFLALAVSNRADKTGTKKKLLHCFWLGGMLLLLELL